MPIRVLTLQSFRNIESAELAFSPQINLFTGANAAGKTSLLEAVHCLTRTRSFRTSRTSRMVRRGDDGFRLVADVRLDSGVSMPVGVGYHDARFEIRINREPVRRLSDLAALFPMQVMAGNIHQLIEEGPRFRRRFLDWGLFHVEPSYAEAWRRYHRILKQRNAALRQRVASAQLRTWDDELVISALQINELRCVYLEKLEARLTPLVSGLLQTRNALRLIYQPGTVAGKSLEESLHHQQTRDRETGMTHSGPHRADIRFEYDGRDLIPSLSRGRQKLLVIALQLAQARMMPDRGQASRLILLDDLGAELDASNQQRVFEELAATDAQVFMTSIDPDPWRGRIAADRLAMFHVEHGKVDRMV